MDAVLLLKGVDRFSFAVGIFPGTGSMGLLAPVRPCCWSSSTAKGNRRAAPFVVVVVVCFSTHGSRKLSSWCIARG